MNKTQLVEQIAANADISKASAGRALDAFIEAVSGTLQSGDQVALVGFGTFSVLVVTQKLAKRSKSLKRKCLHSKQVKL